MNRRTALLMPLVLITMACETPQECLDIEPPEVDELGVTWISEPGWEADAQMADFDGIAEAIEAGTFVETSPGCWRFAPGAHMCLVATACYTLIGMPFDELPLPLDGDPLEVEGPWDYTVADSFGSYGVFDGIAVKLRARS